MIRVDTRAGFLLEVCNEIKKNPVCIELGVFRGEFSEQIINIICPKILYLVDTFELNTEKRYDDGHYVEYSNEDDFKIVYDLFKDQIDNGQVHIIQNKSTVSSWFFPKNYFDFIYIDASHLASDVINDLIMYSDKLTDNGLICGHDYNAIAFPGVKMAVDVFCKKDFEMIIFNENGGDYALRRK